VENVKCLCFYPCILISIVLDFDRRVMAIISSKNRVILLSKLPRYFF